MKNETDVIKIRIDSDVKTELEKIAESEQRTLSGQIRLVLSEWLKTKSARPVRGAAAKHYGRCDVTAPNSAMDAIAAARKWTNSHIVGSSLQNAFLAGADWRQLHQ